MTETLPDDLIGKINEAAGKLLESLAPGGTVSTEQVKAFEAVVEWAKLRKELQPPEKQEAKFDAIRRDFQRETPGGSGTARSSKKKTGANGHDAGTSGDLGLVS